jgi:hypothetical protein
MALLVRTRSISTRWVSSRTGVTAGICAPTEELIRAIPEALYSPKDGRASTSLFHRPRASVSRLAVLPLEHLWRIHLRQLDRPESRLVALAQFNLGAVQQCLAEQGAGTFTVVASPTAPNPAHAEVKEGVPRTPRGPILAVLRLLTYHPRLDEG